MQNRTKINDRRHGSQLKPRIYLFLEFVALAIGSYIVYVILHSLGMTTIPIIILLVGANAYLLTKFFFKCKVIAHRSRFTLEKNFSQK